MLLKDAFSLKKQFKIDFTNLRFQQFTTSQPIQLQVGSDIIIHLIEYSIKGAQSYFQNLVNSVSFQESSLQRSKFWISVETVTLLGQWGVFAIVYCSEGLRVVPHLPYTHQPVSFRRTWYSTLKCTGCSVPARCNENLAVYIPACMHNDYKIPLMSLPTWNQMDCGPAGRNENNNTPEITILKFHGN